MTTELPFSVPERHEAAVKTLLLAKQVLDDLGVPFWLSHGTLLGAIRDNDFIAHDSDIDLGVWDDCEASHYGIRLNLNENGFISAHEFGAEGNGHQFAFWSPFGVYFDIFFYVKEADHCWCNIWTPEPRKQVFPLIRGFHSLKFQGEMYEIPANFEALLEANYGPDWRTPVAPVERGGTWHWADSPLNYEKGK